MEPNIELSDGEEPPQSFSELGLSYKLVSAYKELNFINPTPIQHCTISHGIQGKDLIAQSKAGTGKTLAFLSVLLNKIDPKHETLQGLILVPTRELALQVYDVASRIIKRLTDEPKIKLGLMIGGIPIEDDRNTLRQKVHVVIGTLGRVYGLTKEKSMKLDDVKILVLDEADRLITAHGMKDQLRNVYTRMDKNIPQILSFSATYSEESFKEIKQLGMNHVIVRLAGDKEDGSGTKQTEEEKIDLNVDTLDQYYCKVTRKTDERVGVNTLKSRMVVKILKEVKYDQVIIFYNDKGLGEELESDLREEGILLHFIHGDQTQAERIRIMNKLKLKKVNVILSTDLLSRGIDIEHISLVINYDVPRTMETYFHRIGRTGRFGRYGVSIIFLTDKDEDFILNNSEYFVNIKELPEDLTGINSFLAKNEEEGKVKALAESGVEEKKEFVYGTQSQISEWKTAEYEFYDASKYKYFEEDENKEAGEIIEEPPEEEENQHLDQEVMHDHLYDDDYWAFLKCPVCYQFLLQSEQQLGRKFEILQYFQLEGATNKELQDEPDLG
jgi:superfamily II DNA/RNA helicase